MQELSMNVLDVAENSVAAGAKLVTIDLVFDEAAGTLRLVIADDGKGMDAELAARVTDPFCTSRTSRKVGLGLPFLKMAAELTGGWMSLESQPGKGTTVTALFYPDHIDMPPLGDMAATVAGLVQCNPAMELCFTLSTAASRFSADTREMRPLLGEVSFAEPQVALWLREYLDENIREIMKKE